MNLVKTRLRNQLSQVKLENLLLIATEAPKTRFTDIIFVVDELEEKKLESMFEALFASIWLPDMYPVT